MAGVLIRMKLAVLRHSMTGQKAAWTSIGGCIGLALACGTIWLALPRAGNPAEAGDLLAATYLAWTLGWAIGPVWGGSAVLRPEQFALLPVPRRQLAAGLFGAALVGICPVVTLVAFASLIGYATGLGILPTLVAVPGALLQLAFVVLLGRVTMARLGTVTKSRPGAVVVGLVTAAMMVLAQSGWMVYVAVRASGVLTTGLGSAFGTIVRALPSGWALAAVEAAAEGRWWLAAAALAGLTMLSMALLLAWSAGFRAPRTARVTIRGRRGGSVTGGPVRAALGKELRTWSRDPVRVQAACIPVAWALGTALLPLTFHVKLLVPWAAPGVALMAAAAAANLYGQDGTALWLTLVTGRERADLWARLWCYLIVFLPITAATGAVTIAWSGLTWAVPWVLALTPALLGGGAGLVVLTSVTMLTPGPDAHKRPDNPLEHADLTSQANLLFWATLLTAAPPAALLWQGTVRGSHLLLWSAVPAGAVTGIALAWWLGRVAARRLTAAGPDLLLLMRTGRPSRPVSAGRPAPASWVTVTGWTLGPIALVPQGIVPIVFSILGKDVKVWFLAMHLSGAARWAAAGAMILLGTTLLYAAISAPRRVN